ncbi:NAD-dependent epimerase/dehydratase family protein [Nocardioides currus]|uniref:NAD-dependent epimerase/dehydratase family protein n=1 Tax=Nocardioides currus TaxID=2133958 RepID=UPI00269CF88F
MLVTESQLTVAVTGAAGFIGRHVREQLTHDGHRVVPIDRQSSDDPDHIRDDLSDPNALAAGLERLGVDAVVHAAWSGHPRSAVRNYAGQIRDSVVPTTNTMLACGIARVRKVVLLSSGGGLTAIRQSSGAPPAYGWAKAVSEGIAESHASMFGYALTTIRPSAVYGPGQNPSAGLGAVTVFAAAILAGEPIRILGDDTAVRDYLHVRDLARAVTAALEGGARGTFDLGGPQSVSIRDVIAALEEATGLTAIVEHRPASGVDPMSVQLDDAPFMDLTGWAPTEDFDAGVREVVASLRTAGIGTSAR